MSLIESPILQFGLCPNRRVIGRFFSSSHFASDSEHHRIFCEDFAEGIVRYEAVNALSKDNSSVLHTEMTPIPIEGRCLRFVASRSICPALRVPKFQALKPIRQRASSSGAFKISGSGLGTDGDRRWWDKSTANHHQPNEAIP
jgi:hypothetical protein